MRISLTEQYMGCELALYDVMHHHLDIFVAVGSNATVVIAMSRGHRVGPNPR